jgi:hypothetical protein
LGIVGSHNGFPIQKLAISSDSSICASIAHDEFIRFWNVENLKNKNLDAQSKSKSKMLKNKKLNAKGKSENFFADIIENNEEDDDDDDDEDDDDADDSDDDSSDDENQKNNNKTQADSSSTDSD